MLRSSQFSSLIKRNRSQQLRICADQGDGWLLFFGDNSEVTASGTTETDLGDTLLNGNNIAMVRITIRLPFPSQFELCSWRSVFSFVTSLILSVITVYLRLFFWKKPALEGEILCFASCGEGEQCGRDADIFFPHDPAYTRWQGAQGLGSPSIHFPTSTNTTNHKTPTTNMNIETEDGEMRQYGTEEW